VFKGAAHGPDNAGCGLLASVSAMPASNSMMAACYESDSSGPTGVFL
jgi:hypothetical protein